MKLGNRVNEGSNGKCHQISRLMRKKTTFSRENEKFIPLDLLPDFCFYKTVHGVTHHAGPQLLVLSYKAFKKSFPLRPRFSLAAQFISDLMPFLPFDHFILFCYLQCCRFQCLSNAEFSHTFHFVLFPLIDICTRRLNR